MYRDIVKQQVLKLVNRMLGHKSRKCLIHNKDMRHMWYNYDLVQRVMQQETLNKEQACVSSSLMGVFLEL